jgi:uncharacterized protein YkwD
MSLHGNWVDLIIIAILLFFASEAWRIGLWVILADFLSFSLSLLVSLRGYQITAQLLRDNFSLSHSISNALGFLFTAVITEMIIGFVLAHIIVKLPDSMRRAPWNRVLALVASVGEGFVLIAFLLTLVVGFPVNPTIKTAIVESKIGGSILKQTSGIEKKVNEIFGGVIEDSLTYFTIKPNSHETVPLHIAQKNLSVDAASETQMFMLVNNERAKVGVSQLIWDPSLVPVARSHAKDMWEREYFSHISPEGKDVGNRLDDAHIRYQIAGENLALAPTLQTAHTGLMNSEGHRENILEKRFHKIGIGVIDNGYYGKMFVQVFTN